MEEHKYWCPYYPNCCTTECDIKRCKGEILRAYVESLHKKTLCKKDQRVNHQYSSSKNEELSNKEFTDYVTSIVKAGKVTGGGCSNNQCGGQNKISSKWIIPK